MVERYVVEVWGVLLDLSAPLLVGLALAGLLHAFAPRGLVRRHLSAPTMKSVLRAVLIGVPMPLCSCGVAPTAIGLRNEGASRGAATGFLIATPQTGVDSILVSAGFLGWPFALFKVAAAFVTGLVGGALVNATGDDTASDPDAAEETAETARERNRVVVAARYAVFDLLATIDLWIVAGVLLAAAISVAVPTGSLHEVTWTQGIGGMLLALAVSLPLYVCTTGSVPIAASLIAAGMPPGTALVFLMAGPATNAATLGAVYRALGGRVAAIYVGTVAVMSIGLGATFDFLLGDRTVAHSHQHDGPSWIAIGSAVLLLVLVTSLSARRLAKRFSSAPAPQIGDLTLQVEGMTCGHCVATLKRSIESVGGLRESEVDLPSGRVVVRGHDLDREDLARAIEKAGFKVVG